MCWNLLHKLLTTCCCNLMSQIAAARNINIAQDLMVALMLGHHNQLHRFVTCVGLRAALLGAAARARAVATTRFAGFFAFGRLLAPKSLSLLLSGSSSSSSSSSSAVQNKNKRQALKDLSNAWWCQLQIPRPWPSFMYLYSLYGNLTATSARSGEQAGREAMYRRCTVAAEVSLSCTSPFLPGCQSPPPPLYLHCWLTCTGSS